jgi:hypothetical protein
MAEENTAVLDQEEQATTIPGVVEGPSDWEKMDDSQRSDTVSAALDAVRGKQSDDSSAGESSSKDSKTSDTTASGEVTPAASDATKPDGSGEGEGEGEDWLDQDTRAFANSIGITDEDLSEIESPAELDRMIRAIDRKAYEAGKAGQKTAEGGKDVQQQQKPADPNDPWAEANVSKFKLPVGEDQFTEEAAKPFNDFVDFMANQFKSMQQVVSGFQQSQAQAAITKLRGEAITSIHSLGHADLFGKPGEKPTVEQQANIEKALEAHFIHAKGLLATGRNVSPTPAFLKSAVNLAFGDQIQKTEQRRLADRLRKQSARRTGGGSTAARKSVPDANKPKWLQVVESQHAKFTEMAAENG